MIRSVFLISLILAFGTLQVIESAGLDILCDVCGVSSGRSVPKKKFSVRRSSEICSLLHSHGEVNA